MAMKSVSVLAILSLLALTLPLAIASDPSPLQDFCVGINTPADGADDFFMSGLQNPRPVANAVGSNVTAVNVNNIPGLNTLGISLVRIDYGVDGQNPPHTHPRATEILYVGVGTLFVGFVTSNGDGNPVAFAALSSQNPGVVTIANTLFGSKPLINPNVLARAFQLDPRVIVDLQTKFQPKT
ncbi:unnamed protein product [Thlaspi arvense]|uniref:Cupin type-1 domain-containing protein n=1 Tax=Thlaspi arvense TaxID=13288 RepID=A0AAU9T6V0_THLAR|nr:unnamed protein product [Thlaspi arvense]